MKKFKFIISMILSLVFTLSLFPKLIVFSAEPSVNNENNVNLVIDTTTYEDFPDHFRTTTDLSKLKNIPNLNLEGLDTLNISGSEQFSEMNLPSLIKAINTRLPIIDYDLRQESHGFINGIPVSFENEKDDANKGLTNEQVLSREKQQLNSIVIGQRICFFNDKNKCIVPRTVIDEQTLANNNNLKYTRIFATDEELPDNSVIDDFVESVTKIKGDFELHFHCKEGIGRTTTFMIFYDMMKNYDKVSSNDIVSRQINLAPFNSDDIRLLTSERRINLYNTFYNYCKEHGDNFKVKYSEYVSSNS